MGKASTGPQGGKKRAARVDPGPYPTAPRLRFFKWYKSTPEPPDPNGPAIELELIENLRQRLEAEARERWKKRQD